jgi:methyl-accepting chemotaxis protein
MFATAALCSYVVYYTLMMFLGEKLANVYPQGRLVAIVNAVNFRIMLTLLLVTPLVALIGIFLSHRIAGPVYRMEKFMDSVAAGDLRSHIFLREKDELITFAKGLNRLVDSLREDVTKEKNHLNKITSELQSLKKTAGTHVIDSSHINGLMNKIELEIAELSKILEIYKL